MTLRERCESQGHTHGFGSAGETTGRQGGGSHMAAPNLCTCRHQMLPHDKVKGVCPRD